MMISKNRNESARSGANIIFDIARSLMFPADERIISYRSLSLGIDSGRLTYKRTTRFTKDKYRPYTIVKLLIEARGKEVTYGEFVSGLGDKVSSKSKKKAREQIKSTIKDLRRGFNINRRENPEDDIFIDTGNGYKLK